MESKGLFKIVPFLIGGVLSIIVLVMGFSVMQKVASRAQDEAPRDVLINSITSSSATISWVTSSSTQGVIEYGTSPTALNLFAPETKKDTSHEVELTLLVPSTTYYFQISIGGKKYDNGGVPWSFTTKETGAVEPTVTATVFHLPTERPTPISTVVIPRPTESCREVYCHNIKEKLGKGCTTQDYFRCIRRLTPSPTPAI